MTLKEIYPKYAVRKRLHGKTNINRGSDKGTSHSYIEVYDRLLSRFVGKNATLLEIGVASGKSLLMWEEFLVNGIVYGIDKIGMPNILKDHPKIVYEQMDAYDPLLLENFSKSKKFDIIIEDGSHVLDDQLRAVFTLAPRLKDDGLMIVEDVMPFDHAEKMVSLINGAEIIDLRANGNDKDDVLVVFKKHDVVSALDKR